MKITLPIIKPRDYQLPFFAAFDKGIQYSLISWHRRSGKDVASFACMINKAIQKLFYSKKSENLIEQVNEIRSDIPAVTHVDYSARIQTVDKKRNIRLYNLLKQFKKNTGCSVLVNTSFNVRGEPIVCTPQDAYSCFMLTDMDYLVLGNYILDKKEQHSWTDSLKREYLNKFELD